MSECNNNLNCVRVINKPCVRESRYMRLILWTLQSGSEQLATFENDKNISPRVDNICGSNTRGIEYNVELLP